MASIHGSESTGLSICAGHNHPQQTTITVCGCFSSRLAFLSRLSVARLVILLLVAMETQPQMMAEAARSLVQQESFTSLREPLADSLAAGAVEAATAASVLARMPSKQEDATAAAAAAAGRMLLAKITSVSQGGAKVVAGAGAAAGGGAVGNCKTDPVYQNMFVIKGNAAAKTSVWKTMEEAADSLCECLVEPTVRGRLIDTCPDYEDRDIAALVPAKNKCVQCLGEDDKINNDYFSCVMLHWFDPESKKLGVKIKQNEQLLQCVQGQLKYSAFALSLPSGKKVASKGESFPLGNPTVVSKDTPKQGAAAEKTSIAISEITKDAEKQAKKAEKATMAAEQATKEAKKAIAKEKKDLATIAELSDEESSSESSDSSSTSSRSSGYQSGSESKSSAPKDTKPTGNKQTFEDDSEGGYYKPAQSQSGYEDQAAGDVGWASAVHSKGYEDWGEGLQQGYNGVMPQQAQYESDTKGTGERVVDTPSVARYEDEDAEDGTVEQQSRYEDEKESEDWAMARVVRYEDVDAQDGSYMPQQSRYHDDEDEG